jgi:hypothetical protein
MLTALKYRRGAKLLRQVATTEEHDGVFLDRTPSSTTTEHALEK